MFLKKIKKFAWIRNIYYFYQRGKKGYCDKDLWDLQDWFTKLFPIMLEDFLKQANGYPCGYPPQDVKDTEFWYKEQERKWKYEINKLIWNLKEANVETCSQQNEIRYDVDFIFKKEKENSSFSTLEFSYPTKTDELNSAKYSERERELELYRTKCFKKALNQFEKIAKHLWD